MLDYSHYYKRPIIKKEKQELEIFSGKMHAIQIFVQRNETAFTEQKSVNSMIIASSLLPIPSDVATQPTILNR